jgi:hypothetical protein
MKQIRHWENRNHLFAPPVSVENVFKDDRGLRGGCCTKPLSRSLKAGA